MAIADNENRSVLHDSSLWQREIKILNIAAAWEKLCEI
jgi:hypothetical protein